MTHLDLAQPFAKPKAWRSILPDATGEIGREAVDRPDDPTDTEDFDPDETLPLPMPAVRIEKRNGNRDR